MESGERGEWREERGVLRSEDRGWMSENCLAAISIIRLAFLWLIFSFLHPQFSFLFQLLRVDEKSLQISIENLPYFLQNLLCLQISQNTAF